MRLIPSYLFRQMLGPTLAAVAALGGVALLSQTLATLDIIIDHRQSVLTFAKIVALTMPQMIAMVLPIALFVAALVTLNRLHTEHEIVVCYSAGMSRWEVNSPFFRLASLAALVTLLVNLWVQPWCERAMRDELFKVKTDLAASLVRPGEFVQPSPGLTVYAQSTDPSGQLRNVFIHQQNPDGASATFSAKYGRIEKHGDKPVLVLRQGSNQRYNQRGVLNYLAFDEYGFDLAPYLKDDQQVHYKISDRYMHELVFPDLTGEWERANRKRMLAEAHYRLSTPIYNLTFMALALWAVIGGSFSRVGYMQRIAAAAAIAGAARVLGFGAQAACDNNVGLNVLQYLIPLGPLWWSTRKLFAPNIHNYRQTQGPTLAPLQPALG